MNEEDVKKKLEELFERDIEEIAWKFVVEFTEKNKRDPTNKEMFNIIKKAEKILYDSLKDINKN